MRALHEPGWPQVWLECEASSWLLWGWEKPHPQASKESLGAVRPTVLPLWCDFTQDRVFWNGRAASPQGDSLLGRPGTPSFQFNAPSFPPFLSAQVAEKERPKPRGCAKVHHPLALGAGAGAGVGVAELKSAPAAPSGEKPPSSDPASGFTVKS